MIISLNKISTSQRSNLRKKYPATLIWTCKWMTPRGKLKLERGSKKNNYLQFDYLLSQYTCKEFKVLMRCKKIKIFERKGRKQISKPKFS